MKIKHFNIYLLGTIIPILSFFNVSYSQIDSSIVSKTIASIEDSVALADTTIKILPQKPFLIKFDDKLENTRLQTYKRHKKELDFTNYRYSGDMLTLIPFGFLSDFGSLGTANEPNILNFGFGNISLKIDNNSVENLWNNSVDLNRVQTERISTLTISDPTKGFLHGFNNNPASILIKTNDSIRSKPISRIRYYQASNDEGFIDAFFSARVLPRLSLAIRVTNSSVDDSYENTEFGMWKVNFTTIYKIADSLFTKFNFNHIKLNTPLNGGVDVNNLALNTNGEPDLFDAASETYFSNRKNFTTLNTANASFFGSLFDSSYTKINFGYTNSHELFKYTNESDTGRFSNDYEQYAFQIEQSLEIRSFSARINAGYENINFKIESISLDEKINNYYSSVELSNSFFENKISPSVFGKYSEYNNQANIGFGGNILINSMSGFKLILGYSKFDKPLNIIETQYLDENIEQYLNSFFSSLEYSYEYGKTSISYFDIITKNSPIPIFSNSDLSDANNTIIYRSVADSKIKGLNFNSNTIVGNVLASVNLNYYWQDNLLLLPKENKFNLTAGLYYVDTLYNSNLDLKTGFTFYMFDNPRVKVYDFNKMRSSNFYLQDNVVNSFSDLSVASDKFRLDFLLAGRIQDSATFYFVYENILGNNYFLVPYYPMPDGGVKIGISWDFLD